MKKAIEQLFDKRRSNVKIASLSLAIFFNMAIGSHKVVADTCDFAAPNINFSGKCQGEEIAFQSMHIDNATYQWDFTSDGNIDFQGIEASAAAFTFNSTGSFQTSLLITRGTCTQKSVVQVSIASISRPIFQVDQQCEEIAITNYSTGYDSLFWNISDGTNSKDYSPLHEFKKDGIFEVELSTFKNGCLAKKVVDVSINTITAKPTFSEQKACEEAIIEFKSNSNEANNFKWYRNGELVGENSELSLLFQQKGLFEISLAIDNNLGCYDSITLVDKIEILPKVKADFEISNQMVCEGNTIEFINKSQNAIDFEWDLGDGSVENEKQSIKHIYTPGEYFASIVATNGILSCADTFKSNSPIQVVEVPKVDFSVDQTRGCLPLKLKVKDKFSATIDTSYFLLNNEMEVKLNNGEILIESPGVFELSAFGENRKGGCNAKKTITIEVIDTAAYSFTPMLVNASVFEDSLVQLNWQRQLNVSNYQVYCLGDNGQSKLLNSTNDTFFNTTSINTDSNLNSYFVKAINECGYASLASNRVENIVLNGHFEADSFPTLIWNEFIIPKKETQYAIYRDLGFGFEEIGRSSKPYYVDRSFDDATSLIAKYQIEAIVNETYYNLSNTWQMNFKPRIYIPNAFTPNNDGINDEFSLALLGMSTVDIEIFNRWGQKVFDSEGQNLPWDGTFKGAEEPSSAYICVIKTETPSGYKFKFDKTIHLIR